VRRVVLDVVVTDPKGAPVPGLTKQDFAVAEDGKPQEILSFDANGFSADMDYVPTKLPPQPPNTFINMPTLPEKGPLYVLLYDLVNMDSPDQMDSPEDHHTQMAARQQLVKFIQSKPEGTRFAIFVRSDGLHLIQGFTSDKSLLYSAVDPHGSRPHIPMVFLMDQNFGKGDQISAMATIHSIVTFLDGQPGRKNLLWFASEFPLSLVTSDTDDLKYQEESKETLNLLARNQIALYPVDARGVAPSDSHTQLGTSEHSDTITSAMEAGTGASSGGGGGNSPSQSSSFVQGSSAIMDSFSGMDEMAKETGGQAFYSDNDVAGELLQATESGENYYTLTYAPTNHDFDGNLRNISLRLNKKGYEIAYRRFYYATDSADPTKVNVPSTNVPAVRAVKASITAQPVMDTLSANMQYGAPMVHQLVFVVKANREGSPALGTPAEMATLATEPAYFKSRRKSAQIKPLTPVLLQKHVFNFEIPSRQFKDEPSLNLEVAAAAFDKDGLMMNAIVNLTRKELPTAPGAPEPPRFFRIQQELEIPLGATTVRVAVRDSSNDRTGAMQVAFPLAP
jgi:VWFA-related protein